MPEHADEVRRKLGAGQSYIERVPPRIIRWRWDYQSPNGDVVAGWTFTRRGARRQIEKAERRDHDKPHWSPTVGWPADKVPYEEWP